MKRISTILTLVLLTVFSQSCKKEQPETVKSKTYLIAKITKHFDAGDDQEVFEYDNQDRIITNTFSNLTFKYSYDSNDRVAKNEIYNYRGLLVTYNYTYTNNKMTETRVSPENGIEPQIYTYEINNGNFVRAYLLDGSFIAYDFDSKGNVTHYSYILKNGNAVDEVNLTYDDKKSPFTMVKDTINIS